MVTPTRTRPRKRLCSYKRTRTLTAHRMKFFSKFEEIFWFTKRKLCVVLRWNLDVSRSDISTCQCQMTSSTMKYSRDITIFSNPKDHCINRVRRNNEFIHDSVFTRRNKYTYCLCSKFDHFQYYKNFKMMISAINIYYFGAKEILFLPVFIVVC